jgi:1A family penicillin-binding protein
MPIPKLYRSRHYGHVPGDENLSPREKKIKLIKTIALAAGVGAVVLFIVGTITVAVVSRDLPDPNKLSDRQISQSTKIYDRTGEHLLFEVYQNQKRTLVEMDQISNYVKEATVAVEDKNFYTHSGIRIQSIIRARFNSLIGRRSGAGGGSTLTQQLIKNAIVGDASTGFAGYFRKIKEIILAVRLEKKYSKEQILKLYLNEIPYGSTNYGIEAASQAYFQKNAKDLTLAEAATLAAIPKAPSRYLRDLDALHDRRNLVLSLMLDQGYINEEQKKEAQAVVLKIAKTNGPIEAPHFVFYVQKLLADQFGERAIDEGGLKIITTLDFDKQQIAQKVIKELGDKNAKEANANNAALVSIDPKTKQVLALVGSRDYNNDEIRGKYDVATLGARQPGSSFKPFVYTAAFEKGYTPDTVLYDVKTNFETRTGAKAYSPKNYDGKEHGLVTLRKALQGSLNIPAVKTLYLVGVRNTIEFAKRFGYTTFTGDYGLSLVLGGGEVNLLEHTNAYATLADNGQYNKPVSILKVTNSKGEVLYEWEQPPDQEAVRPEVAATISNVLSDDEARGWIFGRNGNLTLPGRPVAAKTGTTNDNKDAWTMGYVPQLATGVWVGNSPTATPMKAGGNALAGTIWNKYMREALKGAPVEYFPAPPVEDDIHKSVLRGGSGGIALEINSVTGKIASILTPPDLIVKKIYLPPHDILHYVIKDDPRGPAPTNPADDPQYSTWEAALRDWMARQQKAGINLTFEEPPTEYDNSEQSEFTPIIEFVSPNDGAVLTSRDLNLQVQASAPRGITKVIYQIDGSIVGTATQLPFSLSFHAQKLALGSHTLSAVAVDDQGNAGAKTIHFDLQAEFDPASFEWFDISPVTIKAEDFPRVVNIVPFRWEEMKKVDVFLITGSAAPRQIYTFNHQDDQLFNNMLSFTWKKSPGVGEHSLRAVMTDKNGRTVEKVLGVVVE